MARPMHYSEDKVRRLSDVSSIRLPRSMSAQRADDHSARNFVDRLLHTLAQSANVAGSGTMMTDNDPGGAWQRNVKQRVLDLQANHPSMQVANARFALGAARRAALPGGAPPLCRASRGHAKLLECEDSVCDVSFGVTPQKPCKSAAKSPNFSGLVLFCIEADFCIQIRIFQHFSRTTRFAILCTAAISKIEENFRKLFRIFAKNSTKNRYFSTFFIEFCTDFD